MGNIWKTIAIVLLIFFVAFFVWIFIPVSHGDFEEQIITGESNPNFLYFIDSNISYSFDDLNPCSEERSNRIHLAFDILENKTDGLLSFENNFSENGIIFICSQEDSESGEMAGNGGPIYYEGYRTIVSGEVSLFPYQEDEVQCEDFPTLELHEILHVFGFDHFENNKSIMFEGFEELIIYEGEDYQNRICQYIDIEIIGCLKNIYSNGVKGSSCEDLLSFDIN